MKKDAHYYTVSGFARACGFGKEHAHIIAFASQFVDDAKVNLIRTKGPAGSIELETINGKVSFFNMTTCHSYRKIKIFNCISMINTAAVAHSMPTMLTFDFELNLIKTSRSKHPERNGRR